MARQIRVLLVDDEDEWLNKLKAVAQALGFVIDEAKNVAEGARLFEEHEYDLIVSDNSMVYARAGIDFLRTVRLGGISGNRNKETKFALYTGGSDESVAGDLFMLKAMYWHKFDRTPLRDRFVDALA